MRLTCGSLFAGIGGFDLGLERAGWRSVWQVEIDPFRRARLADHWPLVTRYADIREVDWSGVEPVHLVCGGFPCQDLSAAGKLAGLHGARSGLHQEMLYAIEQLEPEWVLIENVFHTWRRWMPQLRRALWGLGYASLPIRLRALEVGAPHIRARGLLAAGRCHRAVVSLRSNWRWPVSDRDGQLVWEQPGRGGGEKGAGASQPGVDVQERDLSDGDGEGLPVDEGQRGDDGEELAAVVRGGRGAGARDLPDGDAVRRQGQRSGRLLDGERPAPRDDADRCGAGDLRNGHQPPAHPLAAPGPPRRAASQPGRWLPEPGVGRVAHGVPDRVDRLSALGDAVVPQVVEWIGKAILRADAWALFE